MKIILEGVTTFVNETIFSK